MPGRLIAFQSPKQSSPATKLAVKTRPAQVVQMQRPIACNYVRMVPAVEENIVAMWRRGVTIRNIAAMYGGRGIGVAQIEAVVWLATHSGEVAA